jgi:hypothetical protein
MKISELKRQLHNLQEIHGDHDIRLHMYLYGNTTVCEDHLWLNLNYNIADREYVAEIELYNFGEPN